MKKYVMILFCLLILFPFSVKAYYCDYNALTRLKKIADNVMVSYDYTENNGNVTFTVTLSNLHPEIYIVEKGKTNRLDKKYVYVNQSELVLTYDTSKTVQYNIYAVDNHGCEKTLLATKYAALPDYNKYYQDPVCKGVESYSLCQKWQKMTLSYDNFVKQVNAYKESLQVIPTPEPTPEQPKETIVDNILHFVGNYYYIFLIIIILGGSFGIYRIYKKNSFKF